jgi:alpha-L-fucosidase 2
MQPLFDMYAGQVYEISKLRTRKYFDIDGVYFPETIYFWGSVFTRPYVDGPPFEEREDPLQESRWHKWAWTSGPELVFIMLNYHDYTHDHEFLSEKIIPLANDFLLFFDNHYPVGDNGEWIMEPSQALETWWDTTNPMPEVAGLRSITKRLLRLPESQTTTEQRGFWQEMLDKIPDLPVRDTPSGLALAPAERFEDKRNIENPELYGVFPFRLIGVGMPNKEWGLNALEHRWDRGNSGWRQDDLFMAYLGLADQTRENLAARSKNYDENSRFPAFWGPNYDWTPDQTHGGVLMKTFQSMIMQTDPYSDSIYLLPAWPEEWDVDFRLHAPDNTLIEGRVKNGEIESLEVTPISRMNDIVIISEDP